VLFDDHYESFHDYSVAAQTKVAQFHTTPSGLNVLDDNDDHDNSDAFRDDVMHGTVLPWIDFEGFEHAKAIIHFESIPKFVFGKLVESTTTATDGGTPSTKWSQSFSLHVHHGLMDGLHMGRFLEKFQANLDNAAALLKD